MSQTKVLLVDDHQIVTQGIRMILDMSDGVLVVGSATNGQEALDFVAETHVDVAVIDISMPVMDGREASRIIKRRYPHVKIIILTTYSHKSLLQELLDIKVDGCMLKEHSATSLVEAIERVMSGRSYFDSVTDFDLEDSKVKLGKRELEVLRLHAIDKSNPEIAEELGLTKLTVKTHLRNIRKKLDVHDSTELIQYALTNGLIS
jgi:DNA-binding NarL/FixJ family response regulator